MGVSTLIGERSGTKLLLLLQTSYFRVILINMTDAHVFIVDSIDICIISSGSSQWDALIHGKVEQQLFYL